MRSGRGPAGLATGSLAFSFGPHIPAARRRAGADCRTGCGSVLAGHCRISLHGEKFEESAQLPRGPYRWQRPSGMHSWTRDQEPPLPVATTVSHQPQYCPRFVPDRHLQPLGMQFWAPAISGKIAARAYIRWWARRRAEAPRQNTARGHEWASWVEGG